MHRLDFDGSFLSIAIRNEQKNSKSFSTSFLVVVVAPVVVVVAVAEVVVVAAVAEVVVAVVAVAAVAVLRDVAQQVMQMIVSAKQLRRGLTEAKECRT